MLVDVFSVLKQDEIRCLIESNENPKFKFVKMLRKYEMQFECDDDNACEVVKKLIYSQPWGRVIVFRVLIHGQFFEGGKVYEDDPIKLMMKRK